MLRRLLALLLTALMLLIGWTCRRRVCNDPRPLLRRKKQPYVMALLHAHQLNAILLNDEAKLNAMVSRSADGDLLIPFLKARGVDALRGSSRDPLNKKHDKGGQAALLQMAEGLQQQIPGLIAIDGPKGPRGQVKKGIVALAKQSAAIIVPTYAAANRRWYLKKTWDLMQIPQPASTLTLAFAKPIVVEANDSMKSIQNQLAAALQELEETYDTFRHQLPVPPNSQNAPEA